MNGTNLNEYVALAQIFVPVIALVGILISMWLSVKALREVQNDRKLRQVPHLAFDYGGQKLPIEFRKGGRRVPGINTEYAESVFNHIPEDAESISLKTEPIEGGKRKLICEYGKLKNYGLGTAFSVEITWIAQKIRIGSEEFNIESKKLLEPQYSKELNLIPSSPRHILPGETAIFFRLPTFIQKDFEKKISEVEGIITIECEDLYKGKHIMNQEFSIFTDYYSKNPNIHITFGNLIKNQSMTV